ncbi:MAG: hypothetical protein FJ102_25175 [Deltaproteobacteria bacterium]|nr:hypothetical protein [Deltaproteobacteria bacterium]
MVKAVGAQAPRRGGALIKFGQPVATYFTGSGGSITLELTFAIERWLKEAF